MQTSLHIKALVSELQSELLGGQIVSAEFYRKLRSAYLFIKQGKKRWALGFVYHPAGSGCFCVPASKVRIDTKEKPRPLLGIKTGNVVAVRQEELDRIFELEIEGVGVRQFLKFEVLGPNGNIWLLGENKNRLASLRKREFTPGEPYASPPVDKLIDPGNIDLNKAVVMLDRQAGTSAVSKIKKCFAGFNETLAREVLRRAGVNPGDKTGWDSSTIESLVEKIGEIADRFSRSDTGYLHMIGGTAEAYPFRLTDRGASPDKFKSPSLAVMAMVDQKKDVAGETDVEKKTKQAVARAVKRKEKLMDNLLRDINRAADYENQKRFAELLQMNRESLKKGMKTVTVEDVLADSGVKVTIRLDPVLSPNENIEKYFRRFRKGRDGLGLLKRRLEITTGEVEVLMTMQSELEADFTPAARKYESELIGLLPSDRQTSEPALRLPYRPTTLATGLTVYIGRDGSDNDRTTFEFARPYELWFHAQQCPGSHVVMKYPNKSFMPSKMEIEETAALAAYHSKARHDSLVPVIYTQRKYVRKPRKSKPGLVTVEREKSVMVAPTKPRG